MVFEIKKRYAVFAHYDTCGIIDDYVLYYLKELKKVADIVFVSDCDLPDVEIEKVKLLTIHQICHKHGEYDFGSYKRGINFLMKKLSDKNQLILCNDSVFGPFVPFAKIFDDMSHCDADMWGIINGDNFRFLMSFFLVINPTIFLKDYFNEFIQSIQKQTDKNNVVLKYEIGLSELVIKNGQKLSSWLNTNELKKLKRSDLHLFLKQHQVPILSCPKRAKLNVYDEQNFYLQFMGFPFLKKLVFKDKSCFFGIYYENIIKNYPIALIKKNINRLYGITKNNVLSVLFFKSVEKIKYFVYQKKVTQKNKTIIKIFKIPVYIK